jgi:hypothetical protein
MRNSDRERTHHPFHHERIEAFSDTSPGIHSFYLCHSISMVFGWVLLLYRYPYAMHAYVYLANGDSESTRGWSGASNIISLKISIRSL